MFFGIAFVITLVLRCGSCQLPAQYRRGVERAGGGDLAARADACLGFGLDPYSMLVPFLIFAIRYFPRAYRRSTASPCDPMPTTP